MEPQRILTDVSEPSPGASDKTEKRCLRRWMLWITLLILAFLLFIFYIVGEMSLRTSAVQCSAVQCSADTNIPISGKPFSEVQSGFLVDTDGCRIPDLDPFDPVIRPFLKEEKPLKCHEKGPLLVAANRTSLFIIKSALSAFNLTGVEKLNCCYQPFWRSNNVVGNKIIFASNCTLFKNEVSIKEEFVKVVCSVGKQVVYKNYHAFVPIKPEVEKRSQNTGKNRQRLSVLVLGVDAVSRLNFYRQMPKTKSVLESMHAIELLGYNGIGFGKLPNLFPLLSGLTRPELDKQCWPNRQTVFDKCKWIWKNFSAAGYRTAFAEEGVMVGLFNYWGPGFKEQPTDYYTTPFNKQAEDDIGYNMPRYVKLCVGSKMSIEPLLEYVSNFAITMSSKNSFAFFWGTSLSHDYLNYPRLGDDLHAKLLKQLQATGSLDHTVLIFMGDYGMRWDGMNVTYQGLSEQRLPFIYFVFPKWFKDAYPTAVANLQKNSHRLTTSLDIYETLLDLLNLEQIKTLSLQERSEELENSKFKPRQISLFLPVHKSRTCLEAGIELRWCTCQMSQPVSVRDATIKNMSLVLVKHLNSLLKPYGVCSELQLREVKYAYVESPSEHLTNNTKDHGLKDYVLMIRTTPGDALFKATVRHHIGNRSIKVAGSVNRINTYGNQSSCITDPHLKRYCYCNKTVIKH